MTGAGHEQRNVNWAAARARWDVAIGLKNQQQLDELIAFFRARKGRAYGFRLKDWTDYKAVGELIGAGDDAVTQFQLVKHYPSGSVTEVRIPRCFPLAHPLNKDRPPDPPVQLHAFHPSAFHPDLRAKAYSATPSPRFLEPMLAVEKKALMVFLACEKNSRAPEPNSD